jgi:hypothetical protein
MSLDRIGYTCVQDVLISGKPTIAVQATHLTTISPSHNRHTTLLLASPVISTSTRRLLIMPIYDSITPLYVFNHVSPTNYVFTI